MRTWSSRVCRLSTVSCTRAKSVEWLCVCCTKSSLSEYVIDLTINCCFVLVFTQVSRRFFFCVPDWLICNSKKVKTTQWSLQMARLAIWRSNSKGLWDALSLYIGPKTWCLPSVLRGRFGSVPDWHVIGSTVWVPCVLSFYFFQSFFILFFIYTRILFGRFMVSSRFSCIF